MAALINSSRCEASLILSLIAPTGQADRPEPAFCCSTTGHKLSVSAVYAVGDKAVSDIAGARAAGVHLTSLDGFLHAACISAV